MNSVNITRSFSYRSVLPRDFIVLENRTFELHSPDGVHSCVLRAEDENETTSWFNSLHSALHVLTVKALQEANKVLSPTLIGGELHHISWLSTRKQRLSYCVEVNAQRDHFLEICSHC